MGTKSHISKALPASIMTKEIGLIVLQQNWMCLFKLSWPLPLCSPAAEYGGWQIPALRVTQRRFGGFLLLNSVSFCSVLYGSLGL